MTFLAHKTNQFFVTCALLTGGIWSASFAGAAPLMAVRPAATPTLVASNVDPFVMRTVRAPGKRRARRARRATTSTLPGAAAAPASKTVAPPVQVIHAPDNESYLTGDQSVAVKGNQNPIIRLGLAPNGVTLAEFPAADRIFAVHPGNTELVFIDSQTANPNDRFLTFRPGPAFVIPVVAPGNKLVRRPGPAAEIMVQMNSGLVITFMFYPVRDLSLTAHRVVVMYNRDEAVATRRAAGLAVNLDGKDPTQAATNSYRVGSGTASDATVISDHTPVDARRQEAHAGGTPGQKDPVTLETSVMLPAAASASPKQPGAAAGTPVVTALAALQSAVASPKQFRKWSRPVHGLSLSTTEVRTLGGPAPETFVNTVVVGVRNNSSLTLRLVPTAPDLLIQTIDDKGKTVNIEPARKLHVEASTADPVVPPGKTVYFAIAYESPILGAHQNLRVNVAQTNAADEPAGANLAAAAARTNK